MNLDEEVLILIVKQIAKTIRRRQSEGKPGLPYRGTLSEMRRAARKRRAA